MLDIQPHLTRELASSHCVLRLNLIKGSFNIVRGVHGLGWAGLREFFDPTHHGGLKKIQPNPTHMDRVGLG